ncbi:MAG: hypothetical protein ACFFD6_02290 [Candidatus Thorarchaeota archaeon]
MQEVTLEDILRILHDSREDNSISRVNNRLEEILILTGAERKSEESWRVDRVLRIELALKAVSLGEAIEGVVNLLTWKDFEGFIADIMQRHNYRCVESFRKRGTGDTKGMEIDVIGVRGKEIMSIDAKMWGHRGGKASALKTAAEKQKERTSRLCSLLPRLSKKINGLQEGIYSLKPIIVTWMVEEVAFSDGVPIVPIFKLNSFLQDMPMYEDLIAVSKCEFSHQ